MRRSLSREAPIVLALGVIFIAGGYLIFDHFVQDPGIPQDPYDHWINVENFDGNFSYSYPEPIKGWVWSLEGDTYKPGYHHIERNGWMIARALPESDAWDEGPCPNTRTEDGRTLPTERITPEDYGYAFCVAHETIVSGDFTDEHFFYTYRPIEAPVQFHFVFRHVTDVKTVSGCQQPGDLATENCQRLQWNEPRDTALFKQVANTLATNMRPL